MKKLITSFFIFSWLLAQPIFASISPNDPYYINQWYLAKINADAAWNKISASPDIIIAVIDSGIQINHPDLRDNIWRNGREISGNKIDDDDNGFIDDVSGWNFVKNIPDPSPDLIEDWTESGAAHGTMIAGIIAASGNNQIGVTGLTWRAQIMPLKALNDRGEGRLSDVIRAIDYALNNGADIINLSFTSFNYSEAMQAAIMRAHEAGVIVVAAAGNEQVNGVGYDINKTPIYPACYDGELGGENMVIGVAATDALDQKARFSSYGSRCIDIAAPGISFFSTVTKGSINDDVNKLYDGYWSGTSMATPLVSASLALIKQANPELNRRDVVNILFAATDDISRLNPTYPGMLGNGRLNVNRAVEMAKEKLYSRIGRLWLASVNSNRVVKISDAGGNNVQHFITDYLNASDSLKMADTNGDGLDEFIIAAGSGSEPYLKIISNEGRLLKKFLAFDLKNRNGLSAAVQDLNGDSRAEIIVAEATNGRGQVKIFSADGSLIRQFSVDSRNWRGGLTVAVGNVDGRGNPEIIVAFGQGSAPYVKIFSAEGRILGAFLAYEKEFRGGVSLAVANLDGRRDQNRDEIIIAPGPGRQAQVKIFNNRGALIKQFLAYRSNWRGGVNLSAGDLTNDGLAEIATGARSGAAPHVRIFSGGGDLLESFYTWEENFTGGVNLGIIKLSNL